MESLNLCIDIGNTVTKAAVFSNNQLLEYFEPFTVDKLEILRRKYHLTILTTRSGSNHELEKELKAEEYISHLIDLPIEIEYDTPATLGRDRISAAVGAYMMDPKASWLVIDLGTCLTMDLLANGIFQGGLISPGVQMRLLAMNHYTADLPIVDMNYEVSFPGKTTEESLQVGVCQSIQYEILGYIRQLNNKIKDLKIVDCSSHNIGFDKEVKNEIFARPKLVLEGLHHILTYNAQE